MEAVEFAEVATTFAAFHGQFAPLFGRREAQVRSEHYLRGLLVQQTGRRNAEHVAAAIASATPRTLQRLLTEAPWDHDAVLGALQTYLGPRLDAPDGVVLLDERAFPQLGDRSVGVARHRPDTVLRVKGSGRQGHQLVVVVVVQDRTCVVWSRAPRPSGAACGRRRNARPSSVCLPGAGGRRRL